MLELDRFSAADIVTWNRLSKDLDELNSILYAGIEPQRQRYREELIDALRAVPGEPLAFDGWARMVTFRYADAPLAAVGSLKDVGGRFNIGVDVDNAIHRPWPALYVASDQETAYREKFGLAKDSRPGGLSPEELALRHEGSYVMVRLDGRLQVVFDLGKPGALAPLCKVLAKIRMPAEAVKLRNRLRIPRRQLGMIRSPQRLLREVLAKNWRSAPVQFGLPAVSQILAGLIIAAGYEGIRYPSTKGDGECVAVFPHRLADETSFVALADVAPTGVQHDRLDLNTAEALCGWEALPRSLRPGAGDPGGR